MAAAGPQRSGFQQRLVAGCHRRPAGARFVAPTAPACCACCAPGRVLKRGGRFLCLEFSKVVVPGLQQLYDLYSFNVIPQIGR